MICSLDKLTWIYTSLIPLFRAYLSMLFTKIFENIRYNRHSGIRHKCVAIAGISVEINAALSADALAIRSA